MDELSSNNHSNGFHSADIISTAYVASLSFFDFFAICLNILLLLSMKKDQYNATEKMQITKTAFLIFAGVICIPLDIVATTRKSTSLMLYFGKDTVDDIFLHTNPAIFLAIAVVRLRAIKTGLSSEVVISGAYAPVVVTMCLMPTVVCIITRLPWHFVFSSTELQTNDDVKYDLFSMVVTSLLPIIVGIYIYSKIYSKLSQPFFMKYLTDDEMYIIKESMKKSILYAVLTTTTTWLMLTVAKFSVFLSTGMAGRSYLAYFKVLIIFMNPFCEGICIRNKKDNLLLLYRRHFKANLTNVLEHNILHTIEENRPINRSMSLPFVTERIPMPSPVFPGKTKEFKTQSDDISDSGKDRTVSKRVSCTGNLRSCSVTEHCRSNICGQDRLMHRNQEAKHNMTQCVHQPGNSCIRKMVMLSDEDLTKMPLDDSCTDVHPPYMSRHNSDGNFRIGQLLPLLSNKMFKRLRRTNSELSLEIHRSQGSLESSSSYLHSYKQNACHYTDTSGGTTHTDFISQPCLCPAKDGEESALSDAGYSQDRRFSILCHSKDSIISSCIDEEDSSAEGNTKQNSSGERRRRMTSFRHMSLVPKRYKNTKRNSEPDYSKVFLDEKRQRNDWRRKVSQQDSIYSITSERPSLLSVTSTPSKYNFLCTDRAESVTSQKKFVRSLSDFF